jgi:spore germination cell wall hydrolase CwlJ-like protein
MFDNLLNASIAVCVFSFFVLFGFFVGKEYTQIGKKPQSVYHTHFHISSGGEKDPFTSSSGKKMMIKDEDKYCLAQNIYFEAGNQSLLGKLAVGLVVMNRVKSQRYPNTVCGVVRQRKQFSWVDDSKSNNPIKDRAWRESLRLSEEVLSGKADFLGFENVTHYHANYVNPRWSKEMQEVAKIDQHIFYRQ